MSTALQVIPEALQTAATDLANIGTSLSEASTLAAPATTAIPAAAADEVSAAVAALFSGHGQWWQTIQAQAAQFHQQFVQLMDGGAAQYASAEAANAQDVVNSFFVAESGRPLFGDGANGYTNAQGVGTAGGNGGWLWGNGGTGGNSTAPGVPGGYGGSALFVGNGGNAGTGGPPTATPPFAPGGAGLGGDGGIFMGMGGTGAINGRSGLFP